MESVPLSTPSSAEARCLGAEHVSPPWNHFVAYTPAADVGRITLMLFVVCYRIVNYPAGLSETAVRRAISDAFHVWSDASQLSFSELPHTRSDADISVQFLTGCHQDGYPFDGPGNPRLSPDIFLPGQIKNAPLTTKSVDASNPIALTVTNTIR